MMKRAKLADRGFTLIEVLIVMIVVAVVASIGLPGLNRMLEGNRLTGDTNRLVSSLYAARSEAVKRGANVFICTRNLAGDDCDGGQYWTDGWIVFADDDNNGAVSAGEVLDVADQVDTGMAFAAGAPVVISFSADGMVDANGNNNAGEPGVDDLNFQLDSDHDSRIIRLGSAGAVRACDPDKPGCP